MKNFLKYSVLALTLGLGSSTFAHAETVTLADGGLISNIVDILAPPPPTNNDAPCAPEVDPSLAISGLAMLGGSLTVLRARRRKQ